MRVRRRNYDQLASGLMVPDWFPGRRRGLSRNREFLFTPGAGCGGSNCGCGGCGIFLDDFLTDDLAANWTQASGSWAISAGTLSAGSSNAILTCNASYPEEGFHNHVVRVVMKAAAGKRSRILFNYSSPSNYNCIEAYWNGVDSYIYLKTVVDGVESTVKTSPALYLESNSWYCFQVCVSSAKVNCMYGYWNNSWPSLTPVAASALATSVVAVGLGTGASSSGLCFGTFSLEREKSADYPDCNGCQQPCGACTDGMGPDAFALSVENYTYLDNWMGSATILNGDWLVERGGLFNPLPSEALCVWSIPLPSMLTLTLSGGYPTVTFDRLCVNVSYFYTYYGAVSICLFSTSNNSAASVFNSNTSFPPPPTAVPCNDFENEKFLQQSHAGIGHLTSL